MSKGSGTSGSRSSGNSGQTKRKVNNQITGRKTISGKAIQRLILAHGGIAKSVSKLQKSQKSFAKSGINFH